MDKTIKMAVSIDYKTLEGNFGKKFGKVGARPFLAKIVFSRFIKDKWANDRFSPKKRR